MEPARAIWRVFAIVASAKEIKGSKIVGITGPACASHSNSAARLRLDARNTRTEGNESLNVILLGRCSHFHGGLYGEA